MCRFFYFKYHKEISIPNELLIALSASGDEYWSYVSPEGLNVRFIQPLYINMTQGPCPFPYSSLPTPLSAFPSAIPLFPRHFYRLGLHINKKKEIYFFFHNIPPSAFSSSFQFMISSSHFLVYFPIMDLFSFLPWILTNAFQVLKLQREKKHAFSQEGHSTLSSMSLCEGKFKQFRVVRSKPMGSKVQAAYWVQEAVISSRSAL